MVSRPRGRRRPRTGAAARPHPRRRDSEISMSMNHVAQTVAELPFFGAERFGGRPAQRFKRDGAWQDLSYATLRDVTGENSQGLVALGVQPGDPVCVLSHTRPDWVHTQFGISCAGG